MTEFMFGFATVGAFLLVAVLFVLGVLVFGHFVRPARPAPEKRSVYECGERPIGQAWFNFNPRFYIVALIFVAFDVEIALTYPVAVVFSRWLADGNGVLAYCELALFLLILFVGLAYVWRKGDLDWIKRLDHAAKELEHKRD
jgi:NADH-quinone oxidoreductase subunit A